MCDPIYVKCPDQAHPETESRLVGARGQGRDGEVTADGERGFTGVMECFKTGLGGWLHNLINLPKKVNRVFKWLGFMIWKLYLNLKNQKQ